MRLLVHYVVVWHHQEENWTNSGMWCSWLLLHTENCSRDTSVIGFRCAPKSWWTLVTLRQKPDCDSGKVRKKLRFCLFSGRPGCAAHTTKPSRWERTCAAHTVLHVVTTKRWRLPFSQQLPRHHTPWAHRSLRTRCTWIGAAQTVDWRWWKRSKPTCQASVIELTAVCTVGHTLPTTMNWSQR